MDDDLDRIIRAFLEASVNGPESRVDLGEDDSAGRPILHAAVQACREANGSELAILVSACMVSCYEDAPNDVRMEVSHRALVSLARAYARSVMKEPGYRAATGRETLQ